MADSSRRAPDYTVKSSEKYLDGDEQVKYRSSFIGVGWKNTDDKGEVRINIKLHALPVNGNMVLWDYKPADDEATSGKKK